MAKRTYWNTTDSSVTIDADGRTMDGKSHRELRVTPEVERAVEQGLLMDQGEVPSKAKNVAKPEAKSEDEAAARDTGDGSQESDETDGILPSSGKNTGKKSNSTKEN